MGLEPEWPAGGYFVWVPVGGLGLDGRAFAGRLRRESRVLVGPGCAFVPPGVTLVNAQGTFHGDPFITLPDGLQANVPLRFRVTYTNTARVYDITFYHGFRVDVFSGPFEGDAPP